LSAACSGVSSTTRWTTTPGRCTASGSSSPGSTSRSTSATVIRPAMAESGLKLRAERLVEPGELDPDAVHLPGVFVQRVVELTPEQAADKHIEKRTVRTGRTDRQEAVN
jgi:hypothetical protein